MRSSSSPIVLQPSTDLEPELTCLLEQDTILKNLVLTDLRGAQNAVLLERFEATAVAVGWAVTGADLCGSTSITETTLATRLLTDLAQVTSRLASDARLDDSVLRSIYSDTPGLTIDRLNAVFERSWRALATDGRYVGLVMGYNAAQNLLDRAEHGEFPLSVLLDLFQSLQRKGIRILLVLAGLPTLFPKLVESRTYAERMFQVSPAQPRPTPGGVQPV